MGKFKKIFTRGRVILILVALLLAIVSIHPNPWVEGVSIRAVTLNSSASLAGIESPAPNSPPMTRERIISMGNVKITNEKEYNDFISTLQPNMSISVKTNKGNYLLRTKTEMVLGDGVEQIVVEDLGLKIYNSPTTNIRKGLDLQGGTRVLLQPTEEVSKDVMELTIENMKERLNVYGISDLVIREAGDLSGNQYILVEVAGMTEEEVTELLQEQGKFEAKIGNSTVFNGGEKDITYVCRSADCSGIDPSRGCSQYEGGWACTFRFSIALRPEAAQRQADLTQDLEVIVEENGQEYLSKDLELFLDDSLVDTLKIGADLKGRAVTDIQISGSGSGATRQEAIYNSLEDMKTMQTVLVTGSLPVKLDIVKIDIISPSLGSEFVEESVLIALLAILAIVIITSIKYRTSKIVIPMAITTIIEVVLILGVASLIGWDMDLAAIAGILIAVGTGIDHQIIIADESLRGLESSVYDWKTKIKRAFFIITGAYLTTVVAMVPLLMAGAGLLKGFALTTIIGTSIGVFISRPAYAKTIEVLLND